MERDSIRFRAPRELLDKIDAECKASGLSRSQLAERLLSASFEPVDLDQIVDAAIAKKTREFRKRKLLGA